MVALLTEPFSSVFSIIKWAFLFSVYFWKFNGSGIMIVIALMLDSISIVPGIIRTHVLELNVKKATDPDEILG